MSQRRRDRSPPSYESPPAFNAHEYVELGGVDLNGECNHEKKCIHGLVCRKNKCKNPKLGESRETEELLYDIPEQQKTPKARWKNLFKIHLMRKSARPTESPVTVKKINNLLVPLEEQGEKPGPRLGLAPASGKRTRGKKPPANKKKKKRKYFSKKKRKSKTKK
jgi:hypothetical protein